MKIIFACLILISCFVTLITSDTTSCSVDKDCATRVLPRCYDKSCVACSSSDDCPIDKYCDKTDTPFCKSYSKDKVLGSFCNKLGQATDCKDIDNYFICGKCKDKDSPISWAGVCIEFECQQCTAGDHNSGIAGDHTISGCYPSGSNSPIGVVKKLQWTDGTPHSTRQDSNSIALIIFGLMFMAILVIQIILLRFSVKSNGYASIGNN
ncbi:hypothetical protein M0812_15506 [Anaeramoeba flamelloides]|uniref:Uncharacterized protein n=1 Tax=Anaeramoeba flamelloides TaxID=1746091 RepID=A0AAV7ZFG0_9EUKA|nr:hypothetical protein M0812_15506 [Anaeramoeba flamelloides]